MAMLADSTSHRDFQIKTSYMQEVSGLDQAIEIGRARAESITGRDSVIVVDELGGISRLDAPHVAPYNLDQLGLTMATGSSQASLIVLRLKYSNELRTKFYMQTVRDLASADGALLMVAEYEGHGILQADNRVYADQSYWEGTSAKYFLEH